LPQSSYQNDSALQCSFENEFVTNVTNIDWNSSFIISDTLDDHQSFLHVSPTPCNMTELNATEDNNSLIIKSPIYNTTTPNKTRSKLPEMSDKGI